jgi:glycosyltransferase involved in cell wall biosynthesis
MRIVFYCGNSPDEWAPPRLTEGIGGSETAVIQIARLFQVAGWRVDVFCHAGRWEGEHDGVGYWEPSRLRAEESCDVLVVWRNPAGHALPVRAERKLLWLHDHNYGPAARADLAEWPMVLGVSAYHADTLRRYYDLDPARVSFVPNGIDLARFDPTVRKTPLRCVYASSPDRGLDLLLEIWPRIRGDEPAELHVAYGWQNLDNLIRLGRRDLIPFKETMERKIADTEGVVWRDRLGQGELAQLYAESYAMLYPSHFLETSCISVMEAMAGGCVPVTSSAGNLKDVVGDDGIVVWGPNHTRSNPYSPSWRDFYVQVARGVIYELNIRKQAELRCRDRAQLFSWEAAFRDHWLPLVESLLRGDAKTDPPAVDGPQPSVPTASLPVATG